MEDLVAAAAAAHQLQHREEDVDGVEIDGEREGDSGGSIAAGADTGEVTDGEQGEDAEGQPGVGVGREEVEEHAGDSGDDEQQQSGEADSGDAAVVDVEEIGDAAHHGHARAGGRGGVEDEGAAKGVDVTLDEGADLPAHEVGEGEEESQSERRVGLAREVDPEDQTEDEDHAGQRSPCWRGGDAKGGDEEADGGDAKHLGQQRGSLLAWGVDDGGITAVLVHAIVVHCHACRSNTIGRFRGEFVMYVVPRQQHRRRARRLSACYLVAGSSRILMLRKETGKP